jgi:hypothetical protein
MKRVLIFLLLSTLVFSITGCRKLIDQYFPGYHGGQPPDCRITEIVSGEVVYHVKYSEAGILDSIVSDLDYINHDVHVISLSYDSTERLTALRRIKGEPDGLNVFHRYGYEGNKITTDTVFDASTSTYRVWLSRITYDSSDRIATETIEILYSDIEGESPFILMQYWYDANGNLIAQPGFPPVMYSDHKNPLRTDKHLQFLARDYSRNAPIGATGFNQYDFPTVFAQPYPFVFNPATGIRQNLMYATGISYTCE